LAIQTYLSNRLTDGVRSYPIDNHGKLRYQYSEVPALTIAGDDGSFADLFYIPPGRVRVLPWLCRYSSSALGASRVLDIGHRAYTTKASDQTQEVENLQAFVSGADVSSAVNLAAFSATVTKYDIYSTVGAKISARVRGGTWPVGATLKVALAYLYE
jgi:hypothetical protein